MDILCTKILIGILFEFVDLKVQHGSRFLQRAIKAVYATT